MFFIQWLQPLYLPHYSWMKINIFLGLSALGKFPREEKDGCVLGRAIDCMCKGPGRGFRSHKLG